MHCVACGTGNRPSAAFCITCRQSIPQPTVVTLTAEHLTVVSSIPDTSHASATADSISITGEESKIKAFRPMVALFSVVLLNIFLYGLLQICRQKNVVGFSDYNRKVIFPLRTDPLMRLATDSFLDEPCEIAHVASCAVINSDDVRRVLNSDPPTATKLLLSKYQYSSLDTLLKDTSTTGNDSDIEQMSANLNLHYVTFFARDWYLNTALYYVVHGREHDALVEYKVFANIVRPQISRGNWLSLPGIDATDLPVISDLFCDGQDQYLNSLCITGILRAVAQTGDDVSTGVSVKDFLSQYEELDLALQATTLASYLRVWLWSGVGDLPVPPPNLTTSQFAAWHYALGVQMRYAALHLAKARRHQAECLSVLARGMNEFRYIESHFSTASVFYIPAINQLKGLQTLGDAFCSPPPLVREDGGSSGQKESPENEGASAEVPGVSNDSGSNSTPAPEFTIE